MWIAITIFAVLAAAIVLVWRLALAAQPTPAPDDPDRQHEVPGADGPAPPRPPD